MGIAKLVLAATVVSCAVVVAGAAEKALLHNVESPVAVTGGPISHDDDRPLAELTITNRCPRAVKHMVVQMIMLNEAGAVIRTVPYTKTGFLDKPDGVLAPEDAFNNRVSPILLDKKMTRVAGLITEVEFDDGSTWPTLPDKPKREQDTDPVMIRTVGYVVSEPYSRSFVACFNQTDKAVARISYRIQYFDADGQGLTSVRFGWGSTPQTPLLKPGEGKVLSGGDGPPSEATTAQASIVKVTFTDQSSWEPKSD